MISKSKNVKRVIATLISVTLILTSIQVPTYGLDYDEQNTVSEGDVITDIAGYKDEWSPLATITVEKGTSYEDIGLPDQLLVTMKKATSSDATPYNADEDDDDDDIAPLADGVVIDDMIIDDATESDALSDTDIASEIKDIYRKYIASSSDALKSDEYLAYVPVEWEILDGEYGNDFGTWDFKAEWDEDIYPLAEDYTPNIFVTVTEKDSMVLPMKDGAVTLDTSVSDGTSSSDTEAILDTDGLYTLTVDFSSEAAAGRSVVIDIPIGLRLISGTGIKSVGNNTYTKAAYTPSELLVFDGYPTYVGDGEVPVLVKHFSKTGTLTYPVQAGTSGGKITLLFRPESYLYDFSGEQTLKDITVKFDGAEDDLAVKIKSIDDKQVVSGMTGTNTKFLDYPFPLTVSAGENYPLLNPSNVKQNLIKEISFDITYKTGAIVSSDTTEFTVGTPTDNGDGTSTVRVTSTSTKSIWTDGRGTDFWKGSITYPASAGFTEGSSYDTTMSNFVWKTVGLQPDGTYADVEHKATLPSSTTQTITPEGEWAPVFQSQQINWEAKNGYDGTQISYLFRTAMMANGYRSFTPVRFRFDADPLDNVSYLTIPTTAQGTVTDVVYKYKGEPETAWHNTDGTSMPGAITYYSAGDQWGMAWRFTAETGKAIEYAYVQYDHDMGVTVGGGGARAYGANVVVQGRPVNDAYTGVFSHHLYSTWQNSAVDGTGTWTQKTSSDVASDTSDHQKFIANGNKNNDHGGFRWSEPDPFKLDETVVDKSYVQSFDDSIKFDGYNRPLADFTLANSTGNTSPDPVRVDFDLDTDHDNVSGITFPYSYNANEDDAAAQVKSLTWEYTDGTTGSWTAGGSEPMPFTPSTTGGTFNAPDGKYFASLSVVLDGWNASTNPVTATVTGRPVDDSNYTDRSQHTMTVTQMASTETELATGTAGYLWARLPANCLLEPTAVNANVNAGASGIMSFTVSPMSTNAVQGYYTHGTFAIVLPSCVTPGTHGYTQDQSSWTGTKPINWLNQEGQGVTLVSSRPATAAEIAQANANATVDQMPADSIIYFYEINNQDATYYRRNLGRYTDLGVQIPITVGALAGDQVYSFQQIAAFGTNLDDGQYSITKYSNAVASDNLNTGDNGVSGMVVRPAAGTTLTINKDPALSVEEAIAASDGVYKTYTEGDDDSVAHFVRDEPGTIKLNIYNTVDSTGITVGTSYVFINIPKASSTTPTMVKHNAFDFTLTGPAVLTSGAENIQSSEIRYLNTTTLPEVLDSDALFAAGSTTLDEDATMIGIKLVWLTFGTGVEIDIPIKAPSEVSDIDIYNEWQARSVFAFQGSSIAIRDNGEKSGFLRADFIHPEWTITYDSQGGSAVAAETVEDAATIYNYDGTTPATKWTKPADPTYDGKVFEGWYTDAACTDGKEFNDAKFAEAPTADVKVYAKWSENTYTVKYDTTGGVPATIADKEDVRWSDASLLPGTDPTRTGYRFDGWNTEEDGTGITATATSTYGTLAVTDKEEITLYAQWIENPDVTITYRVNDNRYGSVSNASETVAPASGSPTGSKVTTSVGYHLDRWIDGSNNTVSTDLTWIPQKKDGLYEEQNYTAMIVPNTDTPYEVHFKLQDATGSGYTEVTEDKQDKTGTSDSATVFTLNTYTGFTAAYVTYTNSSQLTELVSTRFKVAADGSLKIYVYYNRNTYDVTYDAQGHGTAPATQQDVRYGANVTEPADPTATGWTFGGWFKDSGCTAGQEWTFSSDTMPDNDITLYAKWTRNQYKVNFANDGAHASKASISNDAEQTVDYEGYANGVCTVTITSDPVTDYEVIGWAYDYTAADGTQKRGVATGATGYTSVPILEDVTFHAVIYKVPFVTAQATHGMVSIDQTLADAGTPENASASMEGIAYENLPVSAGVKYAPDSENYELTSIVAKDFEATPHKIELKKSDGTLASGTYSLDTVDKENYPVTIKITVDLANRTISTDDTIGISFEFDVVYSPIQTNYNVEHYLMGTDGNYPSSATETEVMPSASTTVEAGSVITYTTKNYTGAAYDATKTTYEDSVKVAQAEATTVKYDGSTVVKLYYKRSAYDMTFDVQGVGTAPAAETNVFYQAKVPAPTDPSAAGYTFDGWYKDSDCTTGEEWDFDTDTMPNSDTTIYAKWTELPDVTINYVVGSDSTGMGSVTKATEDVAPATGSAQGSTANAVTGYHFVNWTHVVASIDTEVDTSVTYVPSKNSDGIYVTDTYIAHFAPNTDTGYIVKYYKQNALDDNYTEVSADKLNKTGTTAAAIDSTVLDKTYTGFTQDHVSYKDSANAESTTALTIAADGSLVVSVYYTRNKHTVTFDANGHGTAPAQLTDVKYEAKITEPTAPLVLGYTFGGWYKDAACTDTEKWNFSTDTMPDDDVTLHAKWTENADVIITYNTDGTPGASVSPTSETVAPATGAATGSTASVPAGYHFVKWTVVDGGATKDAGTSATITAAQVDAYAKASGIYVSKTYTAHYAEDDDVTITYVGDAHTSVSLDSEAVAPATGTAAGSTATPDTGYHFLDWTVGSTTTEAGTAATLSSTQVDAVAKNTGIYVATTFTANSAPNTYTVKFDKNTGVGTDMADQSYTYDEAKNLTANTYTKPGYTFAGWGTTSGATTADYANQASVKNLSTANGGEITLYALWTENSNVVISYVSADVTMGTVSNATDTVAPATGAAQSSTATANTGYHFVNWTKTSYSAWSLDDATIPDSELRDSDNLYVADTYTANFAPDTDTQYTVRYYQQNIADDNYTEVTADKLDKTGTTETDIDSTVLDKTYTGFTKDNVTYEKTGTDATTTAIKIAADGSLIVKVYYTRDKHTVSFDANGHGTAPAQLTGVKYEAQVTEPTAPTEAGYTFGGWFKDAACTDSEKWNFGTDTMPDDDVTLHAKWTENPAVTISYKTDDTPGTSVTPTSEAVLPATGTAAGSTASIPAGYHFVNWTVIDGGSSKIAGTDAVLSPAEVDVYAKASGVYVATTFTANYAEDDDVTITYVSSDTSMGTVTTPSETVAPATGRATGSDAIAEEGYYFVKWIVRDASGDRTVGTDPTLTGAQIDAIAKSTGIYQETEFIAVWAKCTPVILDPPVKKAIAGDTPTENATFEFEMRAVSCTSTKVTDLPMPNNHDGQSMRATSVGAGEVEFGNITFEYPGTYEYSVSEVNNSILNYEYDAKVYTVTYVITQNGDKLEGVRTFTYDGQNVDVATFTNTYTKPADPKPTPGPSGSGGGGGTVSTGSTGDIQNGPGVQQPTIEPTVGTGSGGSSEAYDPTYGLNPDGTSLGNMNLGRLPKTGEAVRYSYMLMILMSMILGMIILILSKRKEEE